MKWIKALDRKRLEQRDYQFIKVGDRIKIYGEETTVEGFYFTYNEGTEKWETIIKTTGRGDPLERSLGYIEIGEDSSIYPSQPQEGQDELWDAVVARIAAADLMAKVTPGDNEAVVKWKKKAIDILSKQFTLIKK